MESKILRAKEHGNGVVRLGICGEVNSSAESSSDKFPRGSLEVEESHTKTNSWAQRQDWQNTDFYSKSASDDMVILQHGNSSGNHLSSSTVMAGSSKSDSIVDNSKDTGKTVVISTEPSGSGFAHVLTDEQLSHSFTESNLELSALEKQRLSGSSFSSSQGLGRSQTAPSRCQYCDNQVDGSHELNLIRSRTERKENQKHDAKVSCMHLDKLSEREKKKLIENLAKVKKDGTVEVDVTRSAPVASELLGLDVSDTREDSLSDEEDEQSKAIPKLNIAMLIVGTRGDVQPFVAIAKRLQEYGHRVRLATHANFRSFVTTSGIEFYPLGGDPRALAEYMARNKGFLPSGPSEISFQRKQLKAIVNSLLPACTEPDIDTSAPFRAQAIIANPPAYGHVHVAEALHVPLHIFFTMPWTPTSEFPHPLARVSQSAGYWLSYLVVDTLIWWGIRSIINDFRRKKLKLPAIAYLSAYHGSISDLPTGYMWSPHLVPKPHGLLLFSQSPELKRWVPFFASAAFSTFMDIFTSLLMFANSKYSIRLRSGVSKLGRNIDWGHSVDVVGFCFLNLGINYSPRQEFLQWLQAGPKPVYVGFGSMPLEDPVNTTSIILEALEVTGQRGIIDKGWGNLGNLHQIPDYVFLLEDCPHDWLFPQCSAVVHHGGAGTTAAGLRAGCPTTIVPFFGDQFFWGDRVHNKGVGPRPIPIGQLTIETLVEAIRTMLDPQVKQKAMELAKHIEVEDGIVAAVNAFHKHLPSPLPDSEPPPEPLSLLQNIFLTLERCFCLPCIT